VLWPRSRRSTNHFITISRYVVGLVNACRLRKDQSASRLNRLLRSLIYPTGCIDRRDVDALLDNYARIIVHGKFQKGWIRGRDEAKDGGGAQAS